MTRIVMFVFNDVRTDSRVLREAESLAAAGHEVTVVGRPNDAAILGAERESRDGFEIVRIPVPARWRVLWTLLRYPWRLRLWVVDSIRGGLERLPSGGLDVALGLIVAVVATPWTLVMGPLYLILRRQPRSPGGSLLDWLARWRWGILGWARAAAAASPSADVYHGHDLTGLPAAAEAARRHGGLVIYDSHEIFLESSSNATRPRWARAVLARLERRWTSQAAALITVNDALAEELGRRLSPRRSIVVHNCPPRPTAAAKRPDLIRSSTGIRPGEPVVLYHGGFWPYRGLEQLAAAIREPGMTGVHAVYLGYGGLRNKLVSMAAEARYGGRLHIVDAVPPADLIDWVGSADVAVMPLQPSTLNHYLSTPNKLFEALAAGVPVVASDFPELRRVLLHDPAGPIGFVCDPTRPADIARAIRCILDMPPDAAADLRARCLRAARERWNWETESAKLVALYADLTQT
jgi:glycosyltransferase involved in cell wall biosynthesis